MLLCVCAGCPIIYNATALMLTPPCKSHTYLFCQNATANISNAHSSSSFSISCALSAINYPSARLGLTHVGALLKGTILYFVDNYSPCSCANKDVEIENRREKYKCVCLLWRLVWTQRAESEKKNSHKWDHFYTRVNYLNGGGDFRLMSAQRTRV
jgi:hypothetical protein